MGRVAVEVAAAGRWVATKEAMGQEARMGELERLLLQAQEAQEEGEEEEEEEQEN